MYSTLVDEASLWVCRGSQAKWYTVSLWYAHGKSRKGYYTPDSADNHYSSAWDHSVLFTWTAQTVSLPWPESWDKYFIYHKSTNEQVVLMAALTYMQQCTSTCQTQFWPFYRLVFKLGQKNLNLPVLWPFNSSPSVRDITPNSWQRRNPV